jgi:hypothetical protein
VISRRTFLLSAAAAVPLAALWRFKQSTDEAAIIAVLHKCLAFLKLDEDGVRAFARDATAANFSRAPKLRLVAALGPLYRGIPLSGNNSFAKAVRHGEERVVSQYLLSTDFFRNGADESKIVRYVAYFDFVKHPIACGNPFARLATTTAPA